MGERAKLSTQGLSALMRHAFLLLTPTYRGASALSWGAKHTFLLLNADTGFNDVVWVPMGWTRSVSLGARLQVPVFYWRDLEASMKYSALSSYTTHPGPLAAYACKVLAYLVASAIQEPPDLAQTTPARWLDQQIAVFVEEVLDNAGAGAAAAAATTDADADADAAAAGGGGGGGGGSADGSADGDAVAKLRRLLSTTPEEESSTERCWNWRTAVLPISSAIKNRGRSYNGYPVSRGYFGSFSFDGLAMALHSVYTTTSFSAAVEKCVNFLGDADSTGSMAGQLAGSIYGYTTIDRRMVANLNAWDDHQTALRGLLLYQLAPGGPNA